MPKHLPLETHELFCNIRDATAVFHWYFRNCFYSDKQIFTPVEAQNKEQIAMHPFYCEENCPSLLHAFPPACFAS